MNAITPDPNLPEFPLPHKASHATTNPEREDRRQRTTRATNPFPRESPLQPPDRRTRIPAFSEFFFGPLRLLFLSASDFKSVDIFAE